jgi:hypothetical protein
MVDILLVQNLPLSQLQALCGYALQKRSNELTMTITNEEQQQNPWYEYNIANNEKLLNETIITLRLTKKHYKTAYTLAHMLGHKSLDNYISHK